MVWRIEFDASASKELKGLDRQAARRIAAFLRNRVASLADPRSLGQALQGPRFGEFRKYRVGDYRVITRIEDDPVAHSDSAHRSSRRRLPLIFGGGVEKDTGFPLARE